jgi:lipopolysaccharide transport system permease protein
MLAEAWSARGLAWRLLHRDLSARYRQSLLGYVWAIVPPLAVTLSFTLAGQAEIFNTRGTSVPYPVFALIGTILWQTFSESLHGPMKAVTAAKPLLARIRFPHEAIVLAKVGEIVFNLTIRLALVVVVLCIYGIPWTSNMLLAPLAIGVLLLLGIALGLVLASIGGLYSDVEMTLSLFLSVWFFVTPVMYEQAAPESVIGMLNTLNPITPILVTARACLTGAPLSHGTGFAIMACVAALLAFFGWLVYRKSLVYMIERVSA